jgi:hypothetical protein
MPGRPSGASTTAGRGAVGAGRERLLDVEHGHDAVAALAGVRVEVLGWRDHHDARALPRAAQALVEGRPRRADDEVGRGVVAVSDALDLIAGGAVEERGAEEDELAVLEPITLARDDLRALRLLGHERSRELHARLLAEVAGHRDGVRRLPGRRLGGGRGGAAGQGDGDQAGGGDERE